MLEIIKVKRKKLRTVPMAASENSILQAQLEQNVPLFSGETPIKLDTAVDGFISTMKNRTEVDPAIIQRLDDYVEELERAYKRSLNVKDIDYELSDSDVEDSPPACKIARLNDLATMEPANDDLGTELEKYFNNLKRKINRFMFYTDEQGRTLCTRDVQKKTIICEFILKSRLDASEVAQFIVAPPTVEPVADPDAEADV